MYKVNVNCGVLNEYLGFLVKESLEEGKSCLCNN